MDEIDHIPNVQETPLDPAAEAAKEPEKPDYVAMTAASGVAPLEMRFSQINSCYRRLPIAYRSYTYINSVLEGVLPPEKYAFAADETERGIRLAKWNIREAIRAIRRFEEAGRNIEFVSVRCPARLALEQDLFAWMQQVLKYNAFDQPEKLCLEFPQSLLYEDAERVRASILSMKLLKVRTMMSGCGAKDCPVTLLMNLPLDYVVLAPWITVRTDSREQGAAVTALLSFLRAIPIDVIADGAASDEQIRMLSRADCWGYIPSSGYTGMVQHGRLRMTLEDALAQKEEEEL